MDLLTVSVAVLLVAPEPLSVALITPVVLLSMPGCVGVTVTLKLHVVGIGLPAASVPPVKLMMFGAVVESIPPQVAVGPLVATVNPAGNVSVKLIPFNATVVLLFVIVKPSEDVCPIKIEVGVNDLLKVGEPTTVNVAVLLVAPVPVSVAEIVPVVLFFKPAEVALTCTEIVQGDAPPASEPPL